MPRPRPWTDDDLRAAVPRATTLAEVCRQLGTEPSRSNDNAIRAVVARLGLDAPHLASLDARPGAPRRRWCERWEWLGEPIRLELDHINGDHVDNRLEIFEFCARTAIR